MIAYLWLLIDVWQKLMAVFLLLASYGFLNVDRNIYLHKEKNNWSLLQSSRSLPQLLMLRPIQTAICGNNLYDLHVVTTSLLWLNWQRLVRLLRSNDAISAVYHKLLLQIGSCELVFKKTAQSDKLWLNEKLCACSRPGQYMQTITDQGNLVVL